MSPFAGAADAVVTGLKLSVATAAIGAPALWATSPTLTDSGRTRAGVKYARDFRRGVSEYVRASSLVRTATQEADA